MARISLEHGFMARSIRSGHLTIDLVSLPVGRHASYSNEYRKAVGDALHGQREGTRGAESSGTTTGRGRGRKAA